jgi:uncharacterized RDD family membrane protein YckC
MRPVRNLLAPNPWPKRLIVAGMCVPYGLTAVMPVVLAFLLTLLMRRFRDLEYISETGSAMYAPLVRRAVAELVDVLIAGLVAALPLAAGIVSAVCSAEDDLLGRYTALIFVGSGFLCMCGTGIVTLLVYSYLEGRYCLTPGKWLLGIRVVGTDLRPCGFWRAFLRNILRFVDGFFNYLVGIMLVAFTENQQRVGDFAARTIVIRKAGAELPRGEVGKLGG